MGLNLGWGVQAHFLEWTLSTQIVPPVEARLAPEQALKLSKSKIFTTLPPPSSLPLHFTPPRPHPGTEDRCVQAHYARDH